MKVLDVKDVQSMQWDFRLGPKKVAGIFGSLVTTFLNLFYYIQVATGDSTPTFVYWILGLISPTGFALGMDRVRAFPLFIISIFFL